MISNAVAVMLILFALPLLLASLYLATLTVIALVPRHRSRSGPASSLRRFAVIVPAHNEEASVEAAVTSLRSLDYPAERVRIVVVADNCDDQTAAVARAAGAEVIERTSDERGKGFALAEGLGLVAGSYDAVVFLDGDCIASTNALRVFNEMLEYGEQVVQARYEMRSRSDATYAALRGIALTLVHLVRPLARERIHASAGLKGSGMCFSRQAIEQIGWHSTGLAEDAEQHVRLLRAGLRVAFAREVIVTGEQPASLGDARGQHRRWESGRLDVALRNSLPLTLAGLRTRSVPMLDGAIDLMIPPVSIVLLGLAGLSITALVVGAATAGWMALSGLLSLAIYFTAGVLLSAPRPIDAVRAIFSVPGYALWKARVYAQSLGASPESWERTRRDP